MFRQKKSLPLGYDRQGYIYFASRLYHELPAGKREVIRRLCRDCGEEYERALFEFVTSDTGATAICMRYSLSRSTLERVVRKYYTSFPVVL